MVRSRFGWLHLTDLHQGMPGQGWLWPNLRETFYDDLSILHRKCGPWHVVFFTGDLTQYGSTAQFSQLDETLANLWLHLRNLGSDPVLIAVPGNHDLVRPTRLRSTHHMLINWQSNSGAHSALWTRSKSEYRQALRSIFGPYQDWWNRRCTSLPAGCQIQHGLLPGDFSLTIPHGDLRIGVVGLNSSFVQLDGSNFLERLHLDVRQFHAACGGDGPAWAQTHDICYLLTHHPPDWLDPNARDQFRSEIDAPGRFVAHLHGHLHEPAQYVISEGGARPRRRWQGRSLFGLEKIDDKLERSHGYAAGQIELYDGQIHLRLWPRSAVKSAAGPWLLGPDRHFQVEDDGGTAPERLTLARSMEPSPASLDASAGDPAAAQSAEKRHPTARETPPAGDPPRPPSRGLETGSEGQQEAPQAGGAQGISDLLSEKIEEAFARKRRLESEGLPTAAISDEIRKLQREHRRGGQLRIGDVLGDRYLLHAPIGRGAFGSVWRARDLSNQLDVAIKVLHTEIAKDGILRERFFRGARIMAGLSHPCVVAIREHEAEDDGYFYLVMDYIAGGNLRDAVRARKIGPERLGALVPQIGEALTAAHSRGMVHRDVKPENIVLTETGEARITDFDLVKVPDDYGGTITGMGLGTPVYAAPEVLAGSRDVDARADVFGLGMTIAFIVHGGDFPVELWTARRDFFRRLPCSESLRRVITRAVDLDREQRFKSIKDLVEELSAADLEMPAKGHAGDAARSEEPRVSWARKYMLAILGSSLAIVMSVWAWKIGIATLPHGRGYLQSFNWSLFPVFFFMFVFAMNASWHPYLKLWRELPDNFSIFRAGSLIAGRDAAWTRMVASLKARRVILSIAAMALGSISSFGSDLCLWGEHGIFEAMGRCGYVAWDNIWLHPEEGLRVDKLTNGLFVLSADIMQALLHSIGFMALLQFIYHEINLYRALTLPGTRVQIRRDSAGPYYGFEEWNRAFTNLYLAVALNLFPALISKVYQPKGGEGDLGQVLLAIVPIGFVVPIWLCWMGRGRIIEKAAQPKDLRLWPFDKSATLILAMILLVYTFIILLWSPR